MSKNYRCYNCGKLYSAIPYSCSCYNINFEDISIPRSSVEIYKSCKDYTEEIDNSCNFKHCKHFGKNPIYEPCCFCNLKRDLRNCYQEEE